MKSLFTDEKVSISSSVTVSGNTYYVHAGKSCFVCLGMKHETPTLSGVITNIRKAEKTIQGKQEKVLCFDIKRGTVQDTIELTERSFPLLTLTSSLEGVLEQCDSLKNASMTIGVSSLTVTLDAFEDNFIGNEEKKYAKLRISLDEKSLVPMSLTNDELLEIFPKNSNKRMQYIEAALARIQPAL